MELTTTKTMSMKSTGTFTLKQAMTEHRFSPRLANELTRILPINRYITDFGCGKGQYMAVLKENGFKCMGIEGTSEIREIAKFDNIRIHDLTEPILFSIKEGTGICLEVLEHIPVEFEATAINNITRACTGKLILSWAVEGQGGCGHVNERNADYVIDRIEREGFEFDEKLTERLREAAGKDLWWFKKSIYVFDRCRG